MTTTDSTTQAVPKRSSGATVRAVSRYGLVGILLLEVAVFAVLQPDTFFTLTQFQSITSTQAVVAILAMAAMMPLVVGQFDVSIGFQLGLGQAICAKLII